MAQGRSPEKWGGTSHTALHSKFPAASLFKTIVTAAALEMTETTADQSFGLLGGCGGQDILPKGEWINDDRGGQMTLRRAFGHSCNSFFAKLAINQLGLGNITRFAHFFGWDQPIKSDFNIEPSKMLAPGAANSTTHTVGRFAAGFGHVGISPIHANWIALALANKGIPKDLKLFNFDDSTINQELLESNQKAIISSESAIQILNIMKATVEEGTASNVFGRGRYRSVAQETGGKTGTLMGRTPQGLTTLFMGVYPLSNPQIAVSSIVVLEDHFYFKASQLAAEAIVNWRDFQDRKNGRITNKTARFLEPEDKKPRKKRYRKF
jgi:cell division protein FtsI/penicillin-binding protein 2